MLYVPRPFIPLAAALLLSAGCSSSSSQDKPSQDSAKTAQTAAGTGAAPTKPRGTGAPAKQTAAPAASGAPAAQTATAPVGPAGDAGTVPPSELEYVEMKVTVDERTGDPKEDNLRFIKIWGEMRNKSSHWVEQIVGDIRYFDASGQELKLDSIGTAVKQDVGDTSPGERFDSDVMFVAPGATVPVHHIRSLDKIGGKYGSYKVALRPARIVTKYPDGALEGVQDQVANVANESLPNSTPHDHRVITATLHNKGTMGCRHPGVVVGFYDDKGKLADLSEGDAPGEISQVVAPGASVQVKVFTLLGTDTGWKAKATVKTWASCSEPYD